LMPAQRGSACHALRSCSAAWFVMWSSSVA
jgi:hypothetical protein